MHPTITNNKFYTYNQAKGCVFVVIHKSIYYNKDNAKISTHPTISPYLQALKHQQQT